MRAADADVLPYDFTISSDNAEDIRCGVEDALEVSHGRSADAQAQSGSRFLCPDEQPKDSDASAAIAGDSAEMDFSPIDHSIEALEKAAASVQQAESRWTELSSDKRAALNAKLTLAERKFAYEGGLPRRPWVKNLLYAPGTLTGYGAKTIPGVREALEQMRYDEAKEQIILAAKVIRDEADYLRQIADEF